MKKKMTDTERDNLDKNTKTLFTFATKLALLIVKNLAAQSKATEDGMLVVPLFESCASIGSAFGIEQELIGEAVVAGFTLRNELANDLTKKNENDKMDVNES